MDQTEFYSLIAAIFERSDAGAGNLADRYQFTNDGVLAVCSEEVGTVGFGVASDLTPTPELVEKVCDLNRLMMFGHYWLSAGSDENHWVLVSGMKFNYDLAPTEYIGKMVSTVMRHHAVLSERVRDYLGDTPHHSYEVGTSAPDVHAFALMGHLA